MLGRVDFAGEAEGLTERLGAGIVHTRGVLQTLLNPIKRAGAAAGPEVWETMLRGFLAAEQELRPEEIMEEMAALEFHL